MFETYVVAELYKELAVRQTQPDLHFWRDRSGHEVDAVLEHSGGPVAIEIKSTETLLREHFSGLGYWRSLAGERSGSTLVYGGDQAQQRSGHRIVPWFNAGVLTDSPE